MVDAMTMAATGHRLWRDRVRRPETIVACLLCLGAMARGEDDTVVDEIIPQGPQVFQRAEENLIDLGANFDANVFGQHGNGFVIRGRQRRGPRNQPAVGERPPPLPIVAQRTAEARLANIEAICGLSASQRQKLWLALESDIRRVSEEIDAERRKYQGVEVSFSDHAGQQKWQQFQQDVQRCQRRLRELGDAASLFGKVLETTLDAEQKSRLRAESESRRDSRWRSMVAAFMGRCDEVLGLDQRQHEELERLLLEKRPRLRTDKGAFRAEAEQEHLVGWMVLSEIDASRLRSIVSDRQSQVLVLWANQGKARRSDIETWGMFEGVTK
jgi:hypothetical protein